MVINKNLNNNGGINMNRWNNNSEWNNNNGWGVIVLYNNLIHTIHNNTTTGGTALQMVQQVTPPIQQPMVQQPAQPQLPPFSFKS